MESTLQKKVLDNSFMRAEINDTEEEDLKVMKMRAASESQGPSSQPPTR